MRRDLAKSVCALFLLLSVTASARISFAQHEQHRPAKPPLDTVSSKPADLPKDTLSSETVKPASQAPSSTSMSGMAAPGALVPDVPLERSGSGTSWLPDHSNAHAMHLNADPWMIMVHGVASLRYTSQDALHSGPRGDEDFSAPNWAMLMAQRPAGRSGQVTLRAMLSLDRITEGGDGYPLLFQSGESWEGEPLVDRQHPHDFFMELAAAYGRKLGEHSGMFLYFGLPGEPALGPPAFMHRPSAFHNLDAPLGHHWQDATHITFGVLTAGYVHRTIKVDASVFTGREPDEERLGIDEPTFDSYSGRFSYNPSPRIALQISAGRLESPEALEPEIDLTRVTFSGMYHHPIAAHRLWNSALIWGVNNPSEGKTLSSLLLESLWEGSVISPYGRAELVQKSGEDLDVVTAAEQVFAVGSLTFGVAAAIMNSTSLGLRAGAQASAYAVPNGLRAEYGPHPWSVEVYLQLSLAPLMHDTPGAPAQGHHRH